MANTFIEYKSKYKNVYKIKRSAGKYSKSWMANLNGNTKLFETEKEAAVCVDLHRISKGKEPVNILIRKN